MASSSPDASQWGCLLHEPRKILYIVLSFFLFLAYGVYKTGYVVCRGTIEPPSESNTFRGPLTVSMDKKACQKLKVGLILTHFLVQK